MKKLYLVVISLIALMLPFPMKAQTHAASSIPFGARVWNGNNPFHQPSATTDFWGSGDADGNGLLTTADLLLAQKMVAEIVLPSPRADVDGNGVVDLVDVSLIDGALGAQILPGWWNQLTTREQRNSWIDRFLALDKTDLPPYGTWWYVCHDFASQLFINSAFYRHDLHGTFFNGGQTRFNIPLYYVSNRFESGAGHAINALLVGDDPTSISDWRFIEPQNDSTIDPSNCSNCEFRLYALADIRGNTGETAKAIFRTTDEGAAFLSEYHPDFILTRPAPMAELPDNRPDLWNPMIFYQPLYGPILFFERQRDDMLRANDIHMANMPGTNLLESPPIVGDSEYSRLLDVIAGPENKIHLLWKGRENYEPCLWHGILDPATQQLSDTTRITQGIRNVRSGRVRITPSNEIHVIWLEFQEKAVQSGTDYPTGIYWTRKTATGWEPALNIAPVDGYLYDPTGITGTSVRPTTYWCNRDLLRYYFDVVVTSDGNLLLVWADRGLGGRKPYWSSLTYGGNIVLRQQLYNGSWQSPQDIESTDYLFGGVSLASDAAGTVHLAYWLAAQNLSESSYLDEGRGMLFHRTLGGSVWSDAEIVDDTENACCARIIAGQDQSAYLIWERKTATGVVPILNRYVSGSWQGASLLSVREGADAWYPDIELLTGGSLAVAWSSRSDDLATIEYKTVLNSCQNGDQNLCINNNRFDVQVYYSTLLGDSGMGEAVPLTPDSGYFWFFNDTNVELLVKVLDGTTINGHFWFFWGAMTDVQYTITVTDMETGAVRTYGGEQGIQKSGNDITAFSDNP